MHYFRQMIEGSISIRKTYSWFHNQLHIKFSPNPVVLFPQSESPNSRDILSMGKGLETCLILVAFVTCTLDQLLPLLLCSFLASCHEQRLQIHAHSHMWVNGWLDVVSNTTSTMITFTQSSSPQSRRIHCINILYVSISQIFAALKRHEIDG